MSKLSDAPQPEIGIKVTDYGDENAPLGGAYLSVHDGSTQGFFDAVEADDKDLYDILIESFAVDIETVMRFSEMERDRGANVLAHRSAVRSTELDNGNRRYRVIEVENLPVVFGNPNRAPGHPSVTQNILLNGPQVTTYIRMRLAEMHRNVVRGVRREVDRFFIEADIRPGTARAHLIDVHTMRDFTPENSPPVTPNNLEPLIDLRTQGMGTPRRTNIITRPPNGRTLSHLTLRKGLKKGMQRAGIKTHLNNAYQLAAGIESRRHAQVHGAATVDAVKRDLLLGDPEDPRYSIITSQPCDEKVERMAKALAEASKDAA